MNRFAVKLLLRVDFCAPLLVIFYACNCKWYVNASDREEKRAVGFQKSRSSLFSLKIDFNVNPDEMH